MDCWHCRKELEAAAVTVDDIFKKKDPTLLINVLEEE